MATNISEEKIEVIDQEKSIAATPIEVVFLEPEQEPHIHFKTILIVFAICCIYFAQMINLVGTGAFARDISNVVGGASDTVWLASAVAILTVILSPPVSQAADYWGRKWFLVTLCACGFVGCLIVSQATSMPMAIWGEVIAGLSYGTQPLLHAIPSEILPRKWRPYAQASVNTALSVGAAFALLVGGVLTRNGNSEGFRPYWYIGAAVYAFSTIICAFLYNPPPRALQINLRFSDKMRSLDWIGYFLLTSGLVLFCMGLSWSQNPYSWNDPHVFATFLLGVILAIGLIVYEIKFTKTGMLDHRLFSLGRNFPIALGGIFIEGLVFFSANGYYAFEVTMLYETDSFIVTLRYSITFIVFAIVSLLAGFYCSRTKKIRLPSIVAFTSFIVFFVLMATSNLSSSVQVWIYPIFLGFGLGICLCTLVTAGQFGTPPELISLATGLMISGRSLGGAIGLAIYNSIFNNQLSTILAPNIAEAALSSGLPKTSVDAFVKALIAQNKAALSSLPGVTIEIISAGAYALKDSYVVAFRYVWVAAGCITFVALVASAFLIDPKQEFTWHIDAPAESEEELYRH